MKKVKEAKKVDVINSFRTIYSYASMHLMGTQYLKRHTYSTQYPWLSFSFYLEDEADSSSGGFERTQRIPMPMPTSLYPNCTRMGNPSMMCVSFVIFPGSSEYRRRLSGNIM